MKTVSKKSKTKPDVYMSTDEEVAKLNESWDKVRCRFCGRVISMRKARVVQTGSGEMFVCKNECRH